MKNNYKEVFMVFCVNCSKEIQVDWKICPYCGKPNVLSQSGNVDKINSSGTIGTVNGGYGEAQTVMATGGGYGADKK